MLYNIQNLARISSKYVLQRLKYCTKCNILLLFIRTMVEMLYVMQYSSPHSRSELEQGVISSGLRTNSIAKVRRLLFRTFSEIAPSRWEFYCYARDVLYCLYARRRKFSFTPGMLILSTFFHPPADRFKHIEAHRLQILFLYRKRQDTSQAIPPFSERGSLFLRADIWA